MRMSISENYKRGQFTPIFTYTALFLIVVAVLFIWINIKVRPFIISVAHGYASNAVSNTLNEIIDEAMKEGEYSFVQLTMDGEGKIAAATMNSPDVNLLMTQIAIGLRDKIANMDEITAKIPLGNFLPYPFLSGMGPEIPVKFLILANTSVSAEESFEDRGINQTLHTISFKVVTTVGIYIPTMHSEVVVENTVPVSKTLIVGTVPDSYTNVEGMEGSVQDTVLDVD